MSRYNQQTTHLIISIMCKLFTFWWWQTLVFGRSKIVGHPAFLFLCYSCEHGVFYHDSDVPFANSIHNNQTEVTHAVAILLTYILHYFFFIWCTHLFWIQLLCFFQYGKFFHPNIFSLTPSTCWHAQIIIYLSLCTRSTVISSTPAAHLTWAYVSQFHI